MIARKSIKLLPVNPGESAGNFPVDKAMFARKSQRNFLPIPLTGEEISKLLWSSYGKSAHGKVVPSAGAIYPLTIYIAKEDGIFKYISESHEIQQAAEGDKRDELSAQALNQSCIRDASAIIIISCNFKKICSRYGERGIRYAYLEAGHAAQNVCLMSSALNLGSVCVGAFNDPGIESICNVSKIEKVIYMVAVGRCE